MGGIIGAMVALNDKPSDPDLTVIILFFVFLIALLLILFYLIKKSD